MLQLIFLLTAIIQHLDVWSFDRSEYVSSSQDFPLSRKENPMKDFSGFTVYPILGSLSKTDFDKVTKVIKSKFENTGKVVILDTENGIDFTGYQGGASLYFQLKNIKTIDGKDASIAQATLSLETNVDIEKTKQSLPSCVWTASCFLDGDAEKKIEEKVSKSLELLLGKFASEFANANPDQKATFFFFTL